ncbi:hypothetical protein [Burkholderia multivorans]|uniref:hypothetical protein n=1 Tax=Burkholderia multivorans TaxID=87883 RepID=UPI001C23480F|nr:hypothetical protein [Burkholderia multivorans]MBU9163594.1 hypothetical protein [Burkholderia multivorans]MBU9263791.1 hypothetical protein [Burkholderia multivorans]MBU9545799.1 hypothetical protein [Burkholderia multivorans]MCA8177425.1 hypothetical protein [Burkholderia multivorans]
MADANLKPRRSRAKSVERVDDFPFVLEEAPYDGFTSRFLPDRNRPAFPWQSAVDRLLATAGFVPGNHVLLSVNYRSQQLTISPDHHYRIANREMTEQEILDRIRDEQQLAAERRHRRRPPSKQA